MGRTRVICLFMAMTLMAMSSPATADELCRRLKSYHSAPLEGSERPNGRRWVELHWVGSWLDFEQGWGFECRDSGDAASHALCAWLVDHSPYEFAHHLPMSMLECYGYRFPLPRDQWAKWRSDIVLWPDSRQLVLEIDFASVEGETGAIRLSSFAEDVYDSTAELPPLAKLSEPSSAE